jgi:hypothetical protein
MADRRPMESKFAGIFQSAAPAGATAAATPAPERTEAPRPVARPVGRPPGKRSDPAWKQYSVLLRRETQRAAAAILREKDEGQDLSGLVENLLDNWIKGQKP